jgi:hypothetical protein
MKIVFFSPHYNRSTLHKIYYDKTLEFFSERDLDIKLTSSFKTLERNVFKVSPIFLALHCHDENQNTKNIIELTKKVRKELPNCIIILTYTDNISFREIISEYSYDVIASAFLFKGIGMRNFFLIYNDYRRHYNKNEIISKLNALSNEPYLS